MKRFLPSRKSEIKKQNFGLGADPVGNTQEISKEEAILMFRKYSFFNSTSNPIKTVRFPHDKESVSRTHYSEMFVPKEQISDFYYITVEGNLTPEYGKKDEKYKLSFSKENNIMAVSRVLVHKISPGILRCYVYDYILTKRYEWNGNYCWPVNKIIE